jgi:rubrerythrin
MVNLGPLKLEVHAGDESRSSDLQQAFVVCGYCGTAYKGTRFACPACRAPNPHITVILTFPRKESG